MKNLIRIGLDEMTPGIFKTQVPFHYRCNCHDNGDCYIITDWDGLKVSYSSKEKAKFYINKLVRVYEEQGWFCDTERFEISYVAVKDNCFFPFTSFERMMQWIGH